MRDRFRSAFGQVDRQHDRLLDIPDVIGGRVRVGADILFWYFQGREKAVVGMRMTLPQAALALQASLMALVSVMFFTPIVAVAKKLGMPPLGSYMALPVLIVTAILLVTASMAHLWERGRAGGVVRYIAVATFALAHLLTFLAAYVFFLVCYSGCGLR
jgi:hypothetical protein